jgi:hypothetical protein
MMRWESSVLLVLWVAVGIFRDPYVVSLYYSKFIVLVSRASKSYWGIVLMDLVQRWPIGESCEQVGQYRTDNAPGALRC